MMVRRTLGVLVMLSSILAGSVGAQVTMPTTAPAAYGTIAARLVEEPNRKVFQLANGLTAIIQVNKTSPSVATRVYIRAGSMTEGKLMGSGVSHVLEHLVSGGTTDKRDEKTGAQLLLKIGHDSNAYTTVDHTCYFINTTTDNWPVALDLLADWTMNAKFTQTEFDREYQVVQRELEMGESEASRVFDKLASTNRYLIHPARHPVIGYKPVFQGLTAQDCRDYYGQIYIPERMIVSLAGNLDIAQAEKMIQERFGQNPPARSPVINLPAEPVAIAPRTTVGHADVKQARVLWQFPTVDLFHPDMYALDVLATVLGDGDSSPLALALKDKTQLVTSVEAYSDTPNYAAGAFDVSVQLTKPENFPAVRAIVLAEVDKLIQQGVEPKLIQKAINLTRAGLVLGRQTAEQLASSAARNYMSTGDIGYSQLYLERLKKVTPEQVQAVARKYLRTEGLLTTVLLPKDVNESVLGKDNVAAAGWIQEPLNRQRLENGITLLQQRNNAAPLVSLYMMIPGGLLAETPANNGIGVAMTQLMLRGSAHYDYARIAEFMDTTGTRISIGSGNNYYSVSMTVLKEHAQPALALLADVLTQPKFEPSDYEKIQPGLRAAAGRITEDWAGEAMSFLRKKFYAESPYQMHPNGTPEVYGKLTAKDLQTHYETYFRQSRGTVVAIMGDYEPTWVEQFNQSLSGFKALPTTLATKSVAGPAGVFEQTTRKKTGAVFIGYGPGMTATNEERFAMTVLKTMLGGYNSPGGSMLHESLRGQGLVYTVQATGQFGVLPGLFGIIALGEADKTDKIQTEIGKIVADVQAGKFSQAQFELAKETTIAGQKQGAETMAKQAQQRAFAEALGLGYEEEDRFADNIRKVTLTQVVSVANKYLTNPVVTVTKPATK